MFGGAPVLVRDDVRDVSVSPDGSLIAFNTNSKDAVWVMNSAGEQAQKVVAAGEGYSLADPSWYPGTRTIVYLSLARASTQMSFQSFDLATGQAGRFRSASGVG